ncbi:MAG: MmcQ/YjbR family DNA-binding protein [Pseudomonadales bacterium]|nr:MmcQ/YjbR family DNA-binding protein [Pseudomonadales bacterium]
MNYASCKSYLLSKPEAREDYPFGADILVPKIKSKMFATLSVKDGVAQMNLKCDPQQALFLRDMFDAVIPGYHMNKKHWNTIILDGTVPIGEIERMIDHSYTLVVKSLKAAERKLLELQYGTQLLYR